MPYRSKTLTNDPDQRSVMKNKTLLLILEFGVPPYRVFLLHEFQKLFRALRIAHTGERFESDDTYNTIKLLNLKIAGEFSFALLNPLSVLRADIILSTFNIYKPHTWMWIFVFPWKKWILWGQGPGKSKSRLVRSFRKLVIRLARGYVVYTEKGKEELIHLGIAQDKITVANNTLFVSNQQRTFGKEYFLYVGRLQPRKGLDLAIKGCLQTSNRLVIVGSGDIRDDLDSITNGSPLIQFLDATHDENQLKDLFSGAIAYLSPEHVGLGVVHSFAYGVPVVTRRGAEHAPEFGYCTDENSYLYERQDELPSLLDEIAKDHRNRDKKGENAYKFYCSSLTPKAMVAAFTDQFERCM